MSDKRPLMMDIAPAEARDFAWIAEQEAKRFSGIDVIPEALLREWHSRNPTGFFLITDEDGRRAGYITILPVRAETLRLFLGGSIVERQIRADAMYSADERELIRDLYVESIVINLSGRARAAALLALAVNFVSMIELICDIDKLNHVYAIAATTPGVNLLRRLGFSVVQKEVERKDGHVLFSVEGKTLMDRIAGIYKNRMSDD
ncbi:MAG: hypothetical protein EHM32_00480 [Spirochaetales bacterium]|nr:MAG: hypothetical protein EHM32_00480 [Spirochaetales bacterium]